MVDIPEMAECSGDSTFGERDPALDPWRIPKTPRAKALVADITAQLDSYEALREPRKRKRKVADRRTHEALVSSVVCGLVHHVLTKPGKAGRVSLSKASGSRYRSPLSRDGLSKLLERMAKPEMAWLTLDIGDWRSAQGAAVQTTITPTTRLRDNIEAWEITLADLGRASGGQTIQLKRQKLGHWDDGGRIEYEDTADTLRMRAEMKTINAMLEAADIEIDDESDYPETADPSDRWMRRVFNNGVFDQGGRLYGGFWQAMTKVERRECILIKGEAVVTLDYGQMAARMAYALQGATPPEGDLYELPGIPRELTKGVVTACLSDSKPRVSFPQGTSKALKGRLRIKDVLDAIATHHPPLSASFGKGLGLGLQFGDSQIIMDVLLQLEKLGVEALPIHDAVIVAESEAEAAAAVMKKTFERHVGVPAVVNVE